ncbi:Transcriptional regulator, MerR family [Leucobacter sp. 7(1)]|uniref:helix-turn-helix domain-containing protein n=1 Tax=Leucobacter sp. 7(1) TaxID=1255613 RepID=UPI00097EE69B|nr:MerR family transcriptional regulator [Leucobacter sp. 7(1)]SJN11932.1 Transcriptional regulator, MerR family [Leucobacter sp. 7(1)]
MAWSTRQLADLTGVTLRSIRHWHDVGLLPAPERLSNGYKQYTAQHLVLALRIARLTSLGFSLEQVAPMLASPEQSAPLLRELREELDERIATLTRVRTDLDDLIEGGISPDLSPEARLAMDALGTDAGSRNVAILLGRMLPRGDMPGFARTVQSAPRELTELNDELLALPPHASDGAIRELAGRGAALIAEFLDAQGDALQQFSTRLESDMGGSVGEMGALLQEHLNPAQHQALMLIMQEFDDE